MGLACRAPVDALASEVTTVGHAHLEILKVFRERGAGGRWRQWGESRLDDAERQMSLYIAKVV